MIISRVLSDRPSNAAVQCRDERTGRTLVTNEQKLCAEGLTLKVAGMANVGRNAEEKRH